MGPVEQLFTPGVAAVTAGVAVCVALVGVVALLRSRRRRRAELDAALVRSRADVEALSRRVEELSHEVVRSRRTAEQEREYVITSLSEGQADPPPTGLVPASPRPAAERPPAAEVAEEQLIRALARRSDSAAGRRWADLVVGAVALGHGVRRGFSADVRDRAAAEAHVARRRSRRDRRRQVREARRVVRDGRPPGQEVA